MKPFIYYAHHKCASSWLNRFLWNVTACLGQRFESFNSDEQFGGDLAERVASSRLDALTLRNARWDHSEVYPDAPGIHVVRDPRDIIVSGYFSHLKTHKLLSEELVEARRKLEGMSKEEGIMAEMSGISGRTLRDLAAWRYGERSGVLELKMEDLSRDPGGGFRMILRHGGWLDEDAGPDSRGRRMMYVLNQLWRRSRGASLVFTPWVHIGRVKESQWGRRLADKLKPISLGAFGPLPVPPRPEAETEKRHDLFFAGRSRVTAGRATALEACRLLAERGYRVLQPEDPLGPDDYFEAIRSSWLCLSPAGNGWDCYRHYEIASQGAVAVMNYPRIIRQDPFLHGRTCLYYDDQEDLVDFLEAALKDKERLRQIGARAGVHHDRHHTAPQVLDRIEADLAAEPGSPVKDSTQRS